MITKNRTGFENIIFGNFLFFKVFLVKKEEEEEEGGNFQELKK